nr:hypothetical protein [Tanacetum cinerariifolium]
MREESLATWDGGNITWGGRVGALGLFLCVCVHRKWLGSRVHGGCWEVMEGCGGVVREWWSGVESEEKGAVRLAGKWVMVNSGSYLNVGKKGSLGTFTYLVPGLFKD